MFVLKLLLFFSLSAPTNMRKLRTYSYRRAINTPPKIVVGQPLKEENEQNGVSRCLLIYSFTIA